MKKLISKLTTAITALALLGFLVPTEAIAQDPTQVDAKHYKVEFENDQVRVLRISYAPGEKSVMHEHPNAVAVFLTDGNTEMKLPDGTSIVDIRKSGEASWTPSGKHLPKNIGNPVELILVELKSQPE
ncbi:MAG: hypothetical protein ACR2MT_02215 [Aurantibacter sp.]